MNTVAARATVAAVLLACLAPLARPADAAPTAEQVYARVRAAVSMQLKVETTQVVPDQPLVELGMDELDLVELIMALEEEFGIAIPDEAVDSNGPRGWHDSVTTRRFAEIVMEQLRRKK